MADITYMSHSSSNTHNWIDGYNAQKDAVAEYSQPDVSKPASRPHPEERDSLNRLQLMLIWFASVLIAVTIYTQISSRF